MKNKDVVEDYDLKKDMSISDFVSQMKKSWGFTAAKIVKGIEIFKSIQEDSECLKFLSFPACIVATGARGVLKEMVKRKMVDAIITTCGTLDHDLARSWKEYYQGSFYLNDSELHRQNINRLGNILIPNHNYGSIIEEKMQELLLKIWNNGIKEISSRELCFKMGEEICRDDSILYWAARNNIPIYIPGLTDGAVGYQLWMFSQDHKLKIDLLKDENELNELIFESHKTGALIIGGGISKHHLIWWNQFKGGLDYAIYVTTAVEWDGSLSGARVREAISWGKVKEKAKRVTIEGDATVILPLMIAATL